MCMRRQGNSSQISIFFSSFFRGNGSGSSGLFILNSLTTVGWGKKVRQRYFLPEIWRYVCVNAAPSITSYRLFDSVRMMIIWDSFSAFLLSSPHPLTHPSDRIDEINPRTRKRNVKIEKLSYHRTGAPSRVSTYLPEKIRIECGEIWITMMGSELEVSHHFEWNLLSSTFFDR